MELLKPLGDPFGTTQTMLICYLGVKCPSPLLDSLRRRLEGVSSGDIQGTAAIQFTFKVVQFLSVCCSSPSPVFIGELEKQDAGSLLSRALAELDSKFRAKRLHLSLVTLFGLLLTSEIADLKQLYPSCEFILEIYGRYRHRRNLINSQCRAWFTKIGGFCDQMKATFVTNNLTILQELRKTDPVIEMMISNVFEGGNRVREHFPTEKGSSDLMGDDDDIGLNLFLGDHSHPMPSAMQNNPELSKSIMGLFDDVNSP